MPALNNCILPDGLLYHVENNIWLKINDDQSIDIGMTDIAQTMAGSIIHCKPKAVGRSVKAGKSLATVESGKWVGPVRCPIGGEVVAINEAVVADATLLNKFPYGQGWIIRLQPSDFEGDRGELVEGDAAIAGFKAYMEEKELGECIHCEGFEA
ncbi:MAG: glycine cleavage system protein H [Candidatus Marinimicrobia bacterium]|nr:glycine cleavage system protein H [Candidatus Neomarinimicrobiota bacterium]